MCPSSPFGSVKGKVTKNLSDYPQLGRCVTSLGKLVVIYKFQFLSIFLISLRFQVFNAIVSVPLICVLLMCDCEILYGLLCLACEIDCKILWGLLGLLCEKCDSFFTISFWWGFHKLRFLFFLRIRLSRRFAYLFVMYAYAHFGTSVCRLHLLIKYFFMLMHLFFIALFMKYFSFILVHLFSDCNCLQISYKRFEHTYGFYPCRRNWFYKFSHLLYKKCSGQEFLDSQTWVCFLHNCGCACFL